jgi:predicted transcriptional regulator
MAMTLRLTDKQDGELSAVAESLNISKQRAMQIALDEYLERNDQDRIMKQVLETVLSRDGELMRRLADS